MSAAGCRALTPQEGGQGDHLVGGVEPTPGSWSAWGPRCPRSVGRSPLPHSYVLLSSCFLWAPGGEKQGNSHNGVHSPTGVT